MNRSGGTYRQGARSSRSSASSPPTPPANLNVNLNLNRNLNRNPAALPTPAAAAATAAATAEVEPPRPAPRLTSLSPTPPRPRMARRPTRCVASPRLESCVCVCSVSIECAFCVVPFRCVVFLRGRGARAARELARTAAPPRRRPRPAPCLLRILRCRASANLFASYPKPFDLCCCS